MRMRVDHGSGRGLSQFDRSADQRQRRSRGRHRRGATTPKTHRRCGNSRRVETDRQSRRAQAIQFRFADGWVIARVMRPVGGFADLSAEAPRAKAEGVTRLFFVRTADYAC